VRGDDFFGFVCTGWIAPWLVEAREQNDVVLGAAASAAGRFAAGGYTVVYDGVVGPWSLSAFAAAAGVAISYVVLLPSEETCLHRVAGRTGHGFTDADATRRMHRQFAGADVDPRHVLAGPEGSPSDVAATVRERWDRGALRFEARTH
jgi:hypothetical protein